MTSGAEDQSLIPTADSSTTSPSGEWTVVSYRRKRAPPSPTPDSASTSPSPWVPSGPSSDSALPLLLLRIRSTSDRLERSKFYRRFLSRLHSPSVQSALSEAGPLFQIVVYGLGSIGSHDISRLQLSLALLLERELAAAAAAIEVFDPVLSATECDVLGALGLSVIRVNEHCRREARMPTLFYMPHCEAELYDNLLSTNWDPARLNQMVILGNSFGTYVRRLDEGYLQPKVLITHVMAVRKHVLEIEMEDGDPGMNAGLDYENDDCLYRAFQGTSWHFFKLDAAADMNSFVRDA